MDFNSWNEDSMNDQSQLDLENMLTNSTYPYDDDTDIFVVNDLPLPQSASSPDNGYCGSDSAEPKSPQQACSWSPSTNTSIEEMPQTPLPEGPEEMTMQSFFVERDIMELLDKVESRDWGSANMESKGLGSPQIHSGAMATSFQPADQSTKGEGKSLTGQAQPVATANTSPPTASSVKTTVASSAGVLEHSQTSSAPAVQVSSRQIQVTGNGMPSIAVTLAPSATSMSTASSGPDSKGQVQVMGNQSSSLPATSRDSSAYLAHLRQDNTIVPSVKTNVMKRGVKRKTDQVQKEDEEVEKEEKIAGGSATIGRNEKNAIAARENRLKKKKEWDDLKNLTSSQEEEIKSLRKDKLEQSQTIKELRDQVDNLKSVLVNESQLSEFLRSMNPTPQLRLDSSMGAFSGSWANSPQGMMSGGVCLHVNGGPSASLEFCAKCSQSAQASLNK